MATDPIILLGSDLSLFQIFCHLILVYILLFCVFSSSVHSLNSLKLDKLHTLSLDFSLLPIFPENPLDIYALYSPKYLLHFSIQLPDNTKSILGCVL